MTEWFGKFSRQSGANRADEIEPDARGARWFRRHLASGVVALTTVVDGQFRASTVTAVMAVSTEPFLVLVSLEAESQMAGWLQQSSVFGLSLLPWTEQFIADQFAGFTPLAPRTFSGIPHHVEVTGSPLLDHAIVWADCRVVNAIEIGDHTAIVGEVLGLGSGDGSIDDPMVYFLNRYRRLQ